jgi:hypothetical protein
MGPANFFLAGSSGASVAEITPIGNSRMSRTHRHLALAIEAEKKGNLGDARELLLRAIRLDDKDEHAWTLLSELTADPSEKLALLRRAITMNPNDAYARRKLSSQARGSSAGRVQVVAPEPTPGPEATVADLAGEASSHGAALRLGDYLVKHCGLDWVALMRAVFRQQALAAEGVHRPLGQILIEMDLIDEATLQRALDHQAG